MEKLNYYSPTEERLNVFSHALGLALSVVALFFLVFKSVELGTVAAVVSFAIFGVSLICLYAASTFYHASKSESARIKMRIVDHAAIYLLIAGTYTPFTLVTLDGWVGWTIFGIVWGMAAIGITVKLFFTGRYDIISTIMYVAMGWMIVFAIKPMIAQLDASGLMWLLGGGIAYTVGAVIYSINRVKYNHAIFHVFVLVGSACHFVAIYFYV